MYKLVCEDSNARGYGIPNTGCGPLEYVLFDGYSFGDRMLEGVMFKLFSDGSVDSVDDWEKNHYLNGLNQKKWMQAAKDYAEGIDIAACPHCNMDVPVVTEADFNDACRDPKGYED